MPAAARRSACPLLMLVSCLQDLLLSGHMRCLRLLASTSELQVAANMCLWWKYLNMHMATREPTRSTYSTAAKPCGIMSVASTR
jgi:hypothetical protein